MYWRKTTMRDYDETSEMYDDERGYDAFEKLNTLDNVYDDDDSIEVHSEESSSYFKSLDELAEMISNGDEDAKNEAVWTLNEFVENQAGGINKLFNIIKSTLDDNCIDYDEEGFDCAKDEAAEVADDYDNDYNKFVEIAVDTLVGNEVIL